MVRYATSASQDQLSERNCIELSVMTWSGPGDGGVPIRVDLVEELGSDAYVYGNAALEGHDERFVVRVDSRQAPQLGDIVHSRHASVALGQEGQGRRRDRRELPGHHGREPPDPERRATSAEESYASASRLPRMPVVVGWPGG
jgi:hypothetical protein